MRVMTHLERLLAALYTSEAWHVLWREHNDVAFKTRSMVTFDRTIAHETWDEAAHDIKGDA